MLLNQGLKNGKAPRNVIRGVNSQKKNEIGVHWLRISFLRRYLPEILSIVDKFFGDSTQDGYGLYSYDSRFSWSNGSALYYDLSCDRADLLHNGKMTLDINGKSLDSIGDIQFFFNEFLPFNSVCTRIDAFFDDYRRLIIPNELNEITEKKDYSGFRQVHYKVSREPVPKKNETKIVHDEIDFGRRGQNGSGKYLRVYDKNLESKGEKDCIRWEVEFTGKRAEQVFQKLCLTRSIDSFATLCGSLVVGSIKFIHRNGDKNISRLDVYDWWQEIIDLLGEVVVRIPAKESDMAGMYHFIYKQVSPTLACLRDTFKDDVDFNNWLFDVLSDGELRMSQRQINLAKENKMNIRYDDGKVFDNQGVLISER